MIIERATTAQEGLSVMAGAVGGSKPAVVEPVESSASSGRRPKILLVASTLHIGGAEYVIASLGEHIDRSQFDVTVCFLKENGIVGEQIARRGVELVALPGYVAKKRDYLTSLKLMRLIRQRGFDLVHTHDLHGFIDVSLCRLLMPKVRFVHTFHFGNYPHREPQHRRLEKLLWRVPDRLVAVGHAQCKTIRTTYGIPEERLEVLWNGVDDPPRVEIDERVRAFIDAAQLPVIASISTLIPQKGLNHLLDAAALLRQRGHDFLLLVIGQGKLRAALEEQAAALGMADRVKFLGWIGEASRRAMPACDIFVQSSLWEAMSVAVIEAMAARKAVVVTTAGDNAYMVDNGHSGLTVPPGDSRALADNLERVLVDRGLRSELARNARAAYDARFTVRHMVSRYEQLYKKMLQTVQR